MTNAQKNTISADLEHDIIDDEQFEEMRDLLEEDFFDLVSTYLVDSEKRLTLLRQAHANNDNANGFEAAHALKGASANIGATELIALGGQLQEACRNQTINQQGACIEQLASALQRAERAINQRLGQ